MTMGTFQIRVRQWFRESLAQNMFIKSIPQAIVSEGISLRMVQISAPAGAAGRSHSPNDCPVPRRVGVIPFLVADSASQVRNQRVKVEADDYRQLLVPESIVPRCRRRRWIEIEGVPETNRQLRTAEAVAPD